MIGKLRGLWPVRRLAAFARGVWDTFLRDNKVIPAVLAVLALFVFAWIVAGSFIGAPDEPVSSRQEVAQTPDQQDSQDSQNPPPPEVGNPNSDSYAAYESKDPFRQLFAPASSGEETTGDTGETTGGSSGGAQDGTGGNAPSGGNNGGSGGGGNDSPSGGNGGNGGSGGNGDSGTSGGAADQQYDNQGSNGSQGKNEQPRTDPTAPDSQGQNGGGRPNENTTGPNSDLFDSGGNLGEPWRGE